MCICISSCYLNWNNLNGQNPLNVFDRFPYCITNTNCWWKITEPLLGRLLACKVDSWSQSVIDYQRGRKEGGSFRPFTRLSSASIRGWPRPEKIPSTPDDWLVVIKHSMEFAFVVVKSGRLGCFENKRPIFTWSRESKEAIRRKVTKVLTRLSRRTLSKTQTHTRC